MHRRKLTEICGPIKKSVRRYGLFEVVRNRNGIIQRASDVRLRNGQRREHQAISEFQSLADKADLPKRDREVRSE